MAIADELQRLIDAKADIKASIENKGVTVGDATLDTYASKIDEIPTGGGGTQGEFKVMFWDYDGTLLKEEYVDSGQDATPPTPPTHEHLTFHSWNVPYTNITRDTHVGALYNTVNNWTYCFIDIPEGGGQTGYPSVIANSTVVVDWGDGLEDTYISLGGGGGAISHYYTTGGRYLITIKPTSLIEFRSGSPLNSNNQPYKIYIGENIGFNGLVSGNDLLQFLVISNSHVTPIDTRNLGALRFIVAKNFTVLPYLNGMGSVFGIITPFTDLVGKSLTYNYKLKYINADITNLNNLGSTKFSHCYRLFSENTILTGDIAYECFSNSNIYNVTMNSVNTIASYAFYGCDTLNDVVINSVTPPSIGSSTFNQNSSVPSFKFYVPDEAVSSYKTATNWTQWAKWIFPISKKPY